MHRGGASKAAGGPRAAATTCGTVFRATRSRITCRSISAAHVRRSMTRWRPSSRTCVAPFGGSASVSVCDGRWAPGVGRLVTARRAVALALVFLIVAPAVAHAWTPGTHVYLGEAVMRSLALLPPSIAALLKEFPYDFLYGSIAADTSIAKKYVPVGRHCHSWNVGMEILDGAGDDPLRAFGLGYLSHLAADSVAHNYFVPKQLAVTSSTSGLGHSYWE